MRKRLGEQCLHHSTPLSAPLSSSRPPSKTGWKHRDPSQDLGCLVLTGRCQCAGVSSVVSLVVDFIEAHVRNSSDWSLQYEHPLPWWSGTQPTDRKSVV